MIFIDCILGLLFLVWKFYFVWSNLEINIKEVKFKTKHNKRIRDVDTIRGSKEGGEEPDSVTKDCG